MAPSKLRDLLSYFAVKTIKFCDGIKGRYTIVNQFERLSTPIGANYKQWGTIHRMLVTFINTAREDYT